jgi:glutathionyl-hydroquinone reductase
MNDLSKALDEFIASRCSTALTQNKEYKSLTKDLCNLVPEEKTDEFEDKLGKILTMTYDASYKTGIADILKIFLSHN